MDTVAQELTEERLQQIRERCEKATPGTLQFEHFDSAIGDTGDYSHCDRIKASDGHIIADVWDTCDENSCNDLAFFAHARTDITALLDALLAARRRTDWIPATPETMPEPGHCVQVMDARYEFPLTAQCNINRFVSIPGKYDLNHVTHWQPLPAPPEVQPPHDPKTLLEEGVSR